MDSAWGNLSERKDNIVAQRMKGRLLKPGYILCKVEGEPDDVWFRLIRRRGPHNSRVAKADLKTGMTVEEGHLVRTSRVKDERKYEDVLFEMLGSPPPKLPADQNARIDKEVDDFVKSKAVSTNENFNDVLRRLLGLDPPLEVIERRRDLKAARQALEEIEREGTIPWDQAKAELGL